MPRPLALNNGAVGELNLPLRLATYTVATLPAASSHTDALCWVSDAPGGRALCQSDGTDWFNVRTGVTVTNKIVFGAMVGGSGTSAATGATTSSVTTTTGSTFLVVVAAFGPSAPTITISDSKSNTYTIVGSAIRNATDGTTLATYLCVGGTGGSGHTFTVNTNNNHYCAIAAVEIKGTTGVVDGTPGTATSNSAAITTSTVTTTNAKDAVIGVCALDASAFPAPATAINLTLLGTVPGTAANLGVGISYELQSATVTKSAQFAGGGTTVNMCAQVFAIKSA